MKQQISSKITRTCRMCLSTNPRKKYFWLDDIGRKELKIKFEKCFRVKIYKNPRKFTYLCTECADSLDSFLELQRKVRRNDSVYFDRLRKKYKCDLCTYQNCRKGRMKSHIEQHHLNINFISCNFCDKKFSRKDSLKDHIQITHNENWNFHCKQCRKKFKLVRQFKDHMKTYHP